MQLVGTGKKGIRGRFVVSHMTFVAASLSTMSSLALSSRHTSASERDA